MDGALVAKWQGEVAFVRRMLDNAKTIEEYVSAAQAASQVAAKVSGTCAKQMSSAARAEASTAVGAAVAGAPTYVLTVKGLPSTPASSEWGWVRAKRWLTAECGLRVMRVEKDFDCHWAIVTFFTQADMDAAKVALAGKEVEGEQGAVSVEEGESADSVAWRAGAGGRKRAREGADGEGRPSKVVRPSHICEVVCPWWKKPYSEQLVEKHARVAKALAGVTEEVQRLTQADVAGRPQWLQDATSRAGAGRQKTCAPLLGVLRSPQLEGYRNKSEFSVGFDTNGEPSVGFLLGGMANGIAEVAAADEVRHTPKEALSFATAVREFIKTKSKLPAWDKRTLPPTGFWRIVLVRSGRDATFMPHPARAGMPAPATAPPAPAFDALVAGDYLVTVPVDEAEGARIAPHLAALGSAQPMASGDVGEAEPPAPTSDHIMVVVQVNPAYFSVQANPELMKEELTALGDHLRAHAKAQGLPLTSLMVQHHSGVCNAAPDTAPIMPFPGQPTDAATTIQDTLCDLRFRISPTAFFQVNSPTTCLLYKMVADWAAPGPNTLLLDVCCGTGTIGLTMARRVQRVVGIDSVASAVADAAANAELNGITNAEYVCGRAEDLMESLLAQHVGGKAGEEVEVVAVVDPPRMGLHRNVLRALLRCSALKRLVFVACNPENAAGNIVALCSPPQPEQAGSGGRGGRGGRRARGGAAPADSWVPFTPVRAAACDLFPHTNHVETVVLLERQ